MSLTWSKFREGLLREITDTKSRKAFERARRSSPGLARFGSPEALVTWLLEYKGHAPSEEDNLLREVLTLYRTDERERGVWLAMLILGLWPSLTWVFQRLWPIGKGIYMGAIPFLDDTATDVEADEPEPQPPPPAILPARVCLDEIIASAIWDAMLAALDDEHLGDVPGIAKRLMYAVRKQARVQLLDSEMEHKRQKHLAEEVTQAIPKCNGEPFIGWGDAFPSLLTETADDPDTRPPDSDLHELTERLIREFNLSSSDVDLLIRHAVHHETLADIARERGGSFPALRQRYSRAIRKLRAILQDKKQEGCHTFGPIRLGVMEGRSTAAETLH